MNILIMDDNIAFTNDIKKRLFIYISNYNDRTNFYVYHDFTPDILNKKYQIAFIDIDLRNEEVDGIKVAEKIKDSNPSCYIIFVSARNDLMHYSLQVQPFFFIRKMNYNEDLDMFFNLFCKKMKNFDIIQITYMSNNYAIPTSDILYLEAYQHITRIFTQDNILHDKRTLKEFCSVLSQDFFVQIHRSLVVNLRYMTNFNSNYIYINDKYTFKVGRTYKSVFNNRVKEFLLK